MPEIGRLLTAMVTPFDEEGALDLEGAQALARRLVEDGSDGVVVFGTTGESPTLTDGEKLELLRAVRVAIPDHAVVAGTGTNDTRHSVELSEQALAAGADALLAVNPYYNKPSQEGLYQHFRAIAETGPTILYNIAGRSAINLQLETTLRLAQLPGIIGTKEASGDLDQMSFTCAGAPRGFRVWSGDDIKTLPLLAVGGYGLVSVTSHLAGRALRRLIELYVAGEVAEAASLHHRLLPLIKAVMTTQSNPIPVKSTLRAMGQRVGPFRLPLVPLTEEELARVLRAVREAGSLVDLAVADPA
ncbi:MAG: 4-hydroxy-tetrahydrodipicolinate synthase [Candidatus Dormibacteraeota bacterium]|nr:4-hydroxy-tetrahydrodipicolinate synthase [Candidatus Dormibacteraeota bacterium]MBO0744606.1 4-hydroxy-tetrahydrodipicolinate synthase [Candidatus Dormibacteraeota bacterium]